jgi:hypothetical protein
MWLLLLSCAQPDPDDAADPGGPCISVASEVHVGDGEIGVAVTAAVEVTNACGGTLVVEDVSLASEAPDGPFEFLLPGPIALGAGESAPIAVTFTAPSGGEHADRLRIDTNDAENPRALVKLTGTGLGPAISVEPESYDLGDHWIGCRYLAWVTVGNEGAEDLQITGARIEGDPAFTTDPESAPPWELLVGSEIALPFYYAPTDALGDEATLVLATSSTELPEVRVPLVGKGTPYSPTAETFTQWISDRLDVLLVVDDASSNSLVTQDKLTRALPSFTSALAPYDYQVAVITTADQRFRGDVVTDESLDPIDEIGVQTLAGSSGNGNAGIETAWRATQPDGDASPGNFLREQSVLTLLFVSAHADDSGPAAISDALAYWRGIVPDRRGVRVHAIAGDVPTSGCTDAFPGEGYDDVVAATGGVFASACDAAYGASLEAIVAGSVADGTLFPLDGSPQPETLSVVIDGAAAAGWSWDATRNAVVFAPEAAPYAGAAVTVEYGLPPDCDTPP